MTEKPKPLGDAFPAWQVDPNLATLSAALREPTTLADLFKLANDEDFKLAVAQLTDADTKALRTLFVERRDVVDVKVKLDTFDGQVITIVGIDWWRSERFVDEARGQTGEGVTLHIRTDADHVVKALTSSSPIVRFCGRLSGDKLPSEHKPLRVFVELVPVRDPARAARGQMMWSIKALPPERPRTTVDGVPF